MRGWVSVQVSQGGGFLGGQGGACLLCRRLSLPLVLFPAPIPPTPFPSGEGGDYRLILPGASPPAPLH